MLKMGFTEEEKSAVLLRLRGLVLQYVCVNGGHVSSDPHYGPFSELMKKFESSQFTMEFDNNELTRLFKHLDGANSYDNAVHGVEVLHPILEKIKRALHPVVPDPHAPWLIKKRESSA